ncbi:hypothetical protein IAQ61_009538, partial [Plenodomus lingam]|uniref:Predicted protein n=1 Tax=Leptosphaeria maculans (strain JN3 / isolate v23.1.3 / race Av1-4-5-6-7-8) TaxID=985895 RepID=E4ZTL5_LEPMJ
MRCQRSSAAVKRLPTPISRSKDRHPGPTMALALGDCPGVSVSKPFPSLRPVVAMTFHPPPPLPGESSAVSFWPDSEPAHATCIWLYPAIVWLLRDDRPCCWMHAS